MKKDNQKETNKKKSTGNNTHRRKVNFWNVLFLLFNIVVSILLLQSICAGYFKPSQHRFTACVGLGFSYLYLTNVLFLLFFIIRRCKYFVYPLIFLLLGIPSVTRLWAIRFNEIDSSVEALKIVSYNVKNLSNSNLKLKNSKVSDKIFEYLKDCDADVILLQEFYTGNIDKEQVFNDLIRKTESEYYCYTCYYPGQNYCIVTLSRNKLFNVQSARIKDKSYAIYCDMEYKGDTIRIINSHLQSLYLNIDEYSSVPQTTEEAKYKFSKLYNKLTKAFCARQLQTDLLVDIIDSSPFEVILCGDFNDTPNSYTYHTISKHLQDSFRVAGKGLGFTFREFPLIRIDYMFHSKGIKPVLYEIDREKDLSDHDIIIGKFVLI